MEAIDGFLRKYKLDDATGLIQKDGTYFHQIDRSHIPMETLLSQALERCLLKITWPKSMRWGSHTTKWVRPIHSILCLLDNKILPIKFGHITASNTTCGHRFLGDGIITVTNIDQYPNQLVAAHVIPSFEDRIESIMSQIKQQMPAGLKLKMDTKLLEEVANLVEKPFVIIGDIPDNLMKLPPEVLIITLKENQKYLLLETAEGKLAPYFIIVANIPSPEGNNEILIGNKRVLQARLYDAMFFYEQDQKLPLKSRITQLKELTYHADIGSVYNKVASAIEIANLLAPKFSLDQELVEETMWLAKTDLLTNMVREFPELQGIMGYYYSVAENLDSKIALAIKEQYKPQGPADEVPSTDLGRLIALADKLDILKQLFALGIRPTGSKDPFALRRAAIGSIRILQTQQIDLSILMDIGLNPEVIAFILERTKFM
jgi:glycyl-tRNA synthetase beta chain